MAEIWRDIKGFEGIYQVSNMGRVKSLNRYDLRGRFIKEKILRPRINRCGYCYVNLYSTPTKYKSKTLHRLVAQAFLPNPNNLPQVNHKNEEKVCNIVWVNEDGSIDYNKSNLEWCSAEYNSNYGTHIERQAINRAVPISQYDLNGKLIRHWFGGVSEVRRELGLNPSNLSACILGRKGRKTCGGFIWSVMEKEKRMAC